MSAKRIFLLMLILLAALWPARAQEFGFGGYEVVSSERVGRTVFEYVMRVRVTNGVAAASGLSAQVFSLSADTEVVEGEVEFGDVGLLDSAVSLDTFTVRHDRQVPFDPGQLLWFASAAAMPLSVTITNPPGNYLTNGTAVVVQGKVGGSVEGVRVQGVLATLSGNSFSVVVNVEEGRNTLSAVATNRYGGLGTANVIVTRDTVAPLVSVQEPAAGAVLVSRQITVSGLVNDAVPGTVNPEQASVTVNGLASTVLNRTFTISDVLLAPGSNTIQVVARDRAGNQTTQRLGVTYRDVAQQKRLVALGGDGQTGKIGDVLPEPLLVELVDGDGVPQTNQPVTFNVTRNDGNVLSQPDVERTLTVPTDDKGQARVLFQLGTRTGAGNNQVTVSSAGVLGDVLFCATATGAPPAKVSALIPENQVGQVSQPLPIPWTTYVTDDGGNPVADVPVEFSVNQGGGNFYGASTVTTNTDGDGRAAAVLTLGPDAGVNNNVAVATVGGVSNSTAVFKASALTAQQAAETRVVGVVLDNANRPMSNILCSIMGTLINGVTDEQGQFALAGVPVGAVRLLVDARNRGYAGEWHFLQFDLVTVAGQDNALDRPIYMLNMDEANAKLAGGPEDVVLQLAGIEGSALTIYAHSVRDANGNPITSLVSWTQVNAERVPMQPPGGSQFSLAWSVQPANLRFDPPARVCMPNTQGQPGQVFEMFGFDHDIGTFVSIGTATVTSDGAQLCSDPGFGITKSGWGGAPPPPPPRDCVGTPPPCKKCDRSTGSFVTDTAKNDMDCDRNNDGRADGICRNGTCIPQTEYDPGEALTDDSAKGGTSIPWDKNGLLVSAGEKMIWNLEGVDKDRRRPRGGAAWTTINGAGPYEIRVTISGEADWDSLHSGTTVKTFNSLVTGNIILWTRTNWSGATITVTAVYKDNAMPPAAPDIGTTKDADYSVTWTLEKRTNCPMSQVTLNPGEAWCPAVPGVWGPAPQCYSYEMRPDIGAAGHPDYQNQTILESFFAVTAYNFTMADVLDNFKTNNPTINTADKVAVFLWTGSNNGTFVVNAQDRIYDQHGGFGANPTPYFTAAKLAAGLGYVLPQEYTCGATVTGNYTITREWKSGNVRIKKDGP